MSANDCRRYRELIGAYLLGQLEEPERSELRRHLEGCNRCRVEVDELRAVVESLGESGVRPDESPPPDLEDRVVSRVAKRDTGGAGVRRAVAVAGIAAALVLLAVLGVFAIVADDEPQEFGLGDEEPIEFVVAREEITVEKSVVVAHTWGTELLLEIKGLEPGEVYTVTLERADGELVPAGTFIGVGEVKVDCQLNGAVLREDARSVSITDEAGEVVLSSEL
ncbi:hypothetical protein E0L93_02930 [Rubrobacter taiwanensis]|jgi:hypothetical protein|uniref:Putative zinc-finger domain-containing protein n=1 Tax=Rubrobacter taiwanensis TaxID=185139 RepID=A0A4R1BQE8_9ACTN|nr:zf-HC2 domain-containing protein [Rubrobacter taiwanensis]TCJ19924.1 hypothetical protein E0L93_02930 [Rubrobacter taiwanensis]